MITGGHVTIDQGGMGGGLVPGIYPPPAALRPTLVGERWAVVAGHPLVSMVAAKIFAAGGNAVDAGVAAGLASNVVQVDMANFGGIAPILIRPADADQCWSVAGIGRWSQMASLDAMLDRHGGALPLDGAPAIVPGAPAGWLTALARFGTMSLADVATPAIDLARDGFLLDHATATSLRLMAPRLQRWPSSVAVYQPQDAVTGRRLRQPALAQLLQHMVDAEQAARGARAVRIQAAHDTFYRGAVAQRIASWVTERGGFMTMADLAAFEAEIEPAPAVEVDGWTFASTPSWSQGPVALQILGIIARTPGSWHDIVEAITLAFNDREDHLAAPDRMDVMPLLSAEHLDACAAQIGDHALSGRPGGAGAGMPTSTTAVVTMDAAGCTFASAPSDTLDGGPIIPELGIMCSPRGVQSRLDPAHPNRLIAGARPTVTPAAIIGLAPGRAWGMACPGGDVIVQAMAQVLWRVLHDGLDIQQAVEAPRVAAFNAPSAFHPHPSADRLVFAEGRIPEAEIAELTAHGHRIERWPDYEFDAGSVQTIIQDRNDAGEAVLLAGADPRRSAYAIAE
jgi:gamma-glutamyltranspeptidase/glutathione hydrolase